MADDVQVANRRLDASANEALIGMARMGAAAFGCMQRLYKMARARIELASTILQGLAPSDHRSRPIETGEASGDRIGYLGRFDGSSTRTCPDRDQTTHALRPGGRQGGERASAVRAAE